MPQYTCTLTFVVTAESQDDAADLAFDAGQHLLETFNDDESIGPIVNFTTEEMKQ